MERKTRLAPNFWTTAVTAKEHRRVLLTKPLDESVAGPEGNCPLSTTTKWRSPLIHTGSLKKKLKAIPRLVAEMKGGEFLAEPSDTNQETAAHPPPPTKPRS